MSQWYCQVGTQLLGPFEFEELRFLKERGQLLGDQLVREGVSGPWQAARDIRELFPSFDRGTADSSSSGSRNRKSAKPPQIPNSPHIPQLDEQRGRVFALAVTAGVAAILVLLIILLLLWKTSDDEPSRGGLASTGRGSGGIAKSGADTGKTRKFENPKITRQSASNKPKKKPSKTNPPTKSAGSPSSKKTVVPDVVVGGATKSISGSQFFGHKAKGNRFVYIVDCSGSMRGSRFTKACNELLRSIHNLGKDQSFYVVFFSSQSYPMFSPGTVAPRLLSASRDNVKRVTNWIESFTVRGGTDPEESLTNALKLKPDAVFFLTDGQIFDGRFGDKMRSRNTGRVPIYTICFQNRSGESLLKQIAAESRGEYRFVP